MLVTGFKTAAIASGIKPGGALDLALIYSDGRQRRRLSLRRTPSSLRHDRFEGHLEQTGHQARAIW